MGAKVQKCIEGKRTYEECIKELRKFSQYIQEKYIDDREKDIDAYLVEKYGNKGKRRFVISSGDEITFVCNARHAFDIMRCYLEGLPKGDSSCIGAAIFRSHMPYSEAYRIAEECCESGKSYMKSQDLRGEACYMDFYYCQGGIGISLDEMRKEEVGELNSKPWLIKKSDTDPAARGVTIDDIEKCQQYLNLLGRSNVKGLAEVAKKSKTEYIMELKRIRAHMDKDARDKVDWKFLSNNEQHIKMVYDMVLFYDIWFNKDENGGE